MANAQLHHMVGAQLVAHLREIDLRSPEGVRGAAVDLLETGNPRIIDCGRNSSVTVSRITSMESGTADVF